MGKSPVQVYSPAGVTERRFASFAQINSRTRAGWYILFGNCSSRFAFYWYNNLFLWSYKNSSNARILYILAELSRTNPERKYPTPEEYYSRLDHDFPESMYADEARRFLRKISSLAKTDTASEYFATIGKNRLMPKNTKKQLQPSVLLFTHSSITCCSEERICDRMDLWNIVLRNRRVHGINTNGW